MAKRRRFPGLAPLAFQHPTDVEALEAVKRVPALDVVMKSLSEQWLEKAFLVESVGGRIKIGPKQGAKIWDMTREACEILSLPDVPQVYLTTHPAPNAYAFGMKRYTITLHSSLVDMMSDDELFAVIGHELTHIKCEHMLYVTMAILLGQVSGAMLGLGGIASLPLRLALLAWKRRAELSCDRGALLCTQDEKPVSSALMKLAGWSPKLGELDMEAVEAQAEEYEKTFDEQAVTKALKYLRAAQSTHPVPVWRVKQIREWSRSKRYEEILEGHYLTEKNAKKRKAAASGKSAGKCRACGRKLDPVFVFCPSCGVAQDDVLVECPQCGKKVESDWKTCPHCEAYIA